MAEGTGFRPSVKETFLARTEDRTLRVAIVGLGYVGLPLLLRFHELGFSVIGLDADPERVEILKSGTSPIRHISSHAIKGTVDSDRCVVTADYSMATKADAILLCVPTPLTRQKEPDMSYVQSSAEALGPHLRKGQLVVLESTVYPGATEEYLLPVMEKNGLKVGRDIHLAYSPEREDPGNPVFSAHNTPKICGGHTPQCLELALRMYETVTTSVVPVSSMRAAELTKLLENIHRSVNIGLVNEMKIVADRMNIDIHEVVAAAATKPFGFTAYHPGPGLGGHCIPIDPYYLTWKAKEYGVNTRFIELAGQVNSAMPEYVVTKVLAALNRQSKSVKDSRIMVCGVAYKKNIDDLRESPAIAIIDELVKMGADVSYSDTYVSDRHLHELPTGVQNLACDEQTVAQQDCVVIATDHDYFDYAMILKQAPVVVDTRGRYTRSTAKVVSA